MHVCQTPSCSFHSEKLLQTQIPRIDDSLNSYPDSNLLRPSLETAFQKQPGNWYVIPTCISSVVIRRIQHSQEKFLVSENTLRSRLRETMVVFLPLITTHLYDSVKELYVPLPYCRVVKRPRLHICLFSESCGKLTTVSVDQFLLITIIIIST